MDMIRRTNAVEVSGFNYVLSDESIGRDGHIVETKGWDLTEFRRNPIALFGHSGGFPIGVWEDVRIEGNKLVGRLKMAAAGTSERIDEIRRLIEQGILRAVSVGFRSLDREPMDRNDPYGAQRFRRQELLETSVVAVPANPAALQRAYDLGISDDVINLAFGEHAETGRDVVRRGATGGHAATSTSFGRPKMTLSDQIVALQDEIRSERDDLAQFTEEAGFDMEESRTMAQAITAKEDRLAGLRDVETALAAGPVPALVRASPGPQAPQVRKPLDAMPDKDVPLADYVLRAHVVNALAKVTDKPREQVLMERYGDLPVRELAFQRKVYSVVTRAASAPATTTGVGWADTLVQTTVSDFIDSLLADSIYPGLSSRGIRTGFGRAGIISFPSRATTPSLAGAFVAQGAPIPVKQGAFTAVTLTLKKLGVITTFTREIAEHSTPDIEDLLRRYIQDDTAGAIDAVLIGAGAATAIAPAGIRNGVTKTTATAGGGFAALVGDVVALATALQTGSNGNLRSPVWLMNPIQAMRIALTQNAAGEFAFANQINAGTLGGYPVIQSSAIAAGMVIFLDAADFVSATGDEMSFNVSDQATLHMEDTTPLPLGTGPQGTGVLAVPMRSLWQTDSLGLRMTMDLNWALLRTGTVAWTDTITW